MRSEWIPGADVLRLTYLDGFIHLGLSNPKNKTTDKTIDKMLRVWFQVEYYTTFLSLNPRFSYYDKVLGNSVRHKNCKVV